MCGLAGILALKPGLASPSRSALTAMAGALAHRGPDEFGIYRSRQIGLSHARLSIVDLQSGQQPMADAEQNHWIVFNGEIFNHVELRAELQALGHQFRTSSDTEVILHAWQAWGVRAFERMNGQWALALWDVRNEQLILCRDPLGICPLHLCEHAGYLYFGSEIKSIFAADAGIPRAWDAYGLQQTLTFWSTVPPRTVYQGVTELEPGHLRIFRCRGGTFQAIDQSFSVPLPAAAPADYFQGSLADAVVAVRETLQSATRLRMQRADVPVGCYLSGGLDSSLVAALAQPYAGSRFRTFSLRFDDAEYDESHYQKLMVQRLACEHSELSVSRQDIAEVFPQVIQHTERPILRTAPAPLFLLSRHVRDHGIKVVLTGEGADEMFGGYDLFREGKVRRFWGRQPQSAWRHRLLERLYPYLARSPVAQRAMAKQFFGQGIELHATPGFAHGPRWQTTSALLRLLSPELKAAIAEQKPVPDFLATLHPQFGQWDRLAQDQHIEIRTLLAGYLLSSQGDRMLLGHGVEGRFPFLDPEVVALAHSLPASYKLRVLDEKHVLKQAACDFVAPEILARSKQPYRAPDALSFVGPDAPDYVREMLSDEALRQAQVFDVKAASQLIAKCRLRAKDGQFSNSDNMALVGVLSTQLLHHQFMSRHVEQTPRIVWRTDVERLENDNHVC